MFHRHRLIAVLRFRIVLGFVLVVLSSGNAVSRESWSSAAPFDSLGGRNSQPRTFLGSKALDPIAGRTTRVSIARPANGLPVVAYAVDEDGTFKFVRCLDFECGTASEPVTIAQGFSGQGHDMAIKPDGFPVIAYRPAPGGVAVAACHDAACALITRTVVSADTGVGRFISMAIGADGLPLLVASRMGQLVVIKCSDANCSASVSTEIPDTGSPLDRYGFGNSVAIAADGSPVIAYLKSMDLRVAHCSSSSCAGNTEINTIDSFLKLDSPISIAIGQNGLPLVAYAAYNGSYIRLARCVDLACSAHTQATIASTTSARPPEVALDVGPDGFPAMSFATADTVFDLALCSDATCDAPVRHCTTSGLGVTGRYTDLIFGSDGFPTAVYSFHTGPQILRCVGSFFHSGFEALL